jgi:MFS transporter, UMF1 family
MTPRNDPSPTVPRVPSNLSRVSKHSLRSYSSSFEADDERSSTGSDEPRISPETMSPSLNGEGNGNGVSPPARYPGEDTRPTSRKELAGWLTYAFAGEPYVICGQSLVALGMMHSLFFSCADSYQESVRSTVTQLLESTMRVHLRR